MLQGDGSKTVKQFGLAQEDCPKCGSVLFLRVLKGTPIPLGLKLPAGLRAPSGSELVKGQRMEAICLVCGYYQGHEAEGMNWKLVTERQGNASKSLPQSE